MNIYIYTMDTIKKQKIISAMMENAMDSTVVHGSQ